jgi:putative hemolysin
MSGILIEVLLILMLLVINGVFSMSELAVVSSRKTRLEHWAEDGDAGAHAALALASHPTNFLSTVQVGITLVGVLAGAFGGAGLAEELGRALAGVPGIGRYSQPVALGIVVGIITYLSLIIGELVPKQIALRNPERVAAFVARPMTWLAKIGAPVVSLLTGSTNLVFRLLGIRASADPSITEQDIRAMVEQGAEAGAVAPVEHEIVENTFRLGDRRVSTIMTPRPDVAWVDVHANAGTLRDTLASAGRAPLLVCDGDVEHVIGVASAEALLLQMLDRGAVSVRGAMQPAIFVPAAMPVLDLLETFRRSRQTVTVVLDEFGGLAGIATMDDIVEALVGDMPEPGDASPPEIERRADGSWRVDGATALTTVEARIDVDLPEDDGRRGYDTVGGLVMTRLGRIPTTGDAFEYASARFVVERMDGRRVESVVITLLPRA